MAITMIVMMGMAAVAIDLSLGFNERRQDQIAADVGVMAGAIDFLSANQNDEITTAALEYVWNNLPSASAGSWDVDATYAAAFRSCEDPEASTLGLGLASVKEPAINATWDGTGSVSQPGKLPCISVSPFGFVRVRVPDQFVNTSFGRLLGFDQLVTAADAVAQIVVRGRLGILPFGLPNGATAGDHLCLSSGPTGLAEDPCTGPNSGNFGTLKIPQWGSPILNTVANCVSAPVGDTLAVNIALGVDHIIFLAPSTDALDEIRDDKPNCESLTFGVNTVNTDTGFPNNGAEGGLVGPLPAAAPAGSVPRLLNTSNPANPNLFGVAIDDKPLWEYLKSTIEGAFPMMGAMANVPQVCDPDTFDDTLVGYTPPGGWPAPAMLQDDWNGDGIVDLYRSWEHMKYCLVVYEATYAGSGPWAELFTDDDDSSTADIADSPRFSYTPQVFEPDLGTGNSWLHVRQFRATWIQGTWWKKGNDWSVHHPGEGCDMSGGGSCASNESMVQISALLIPDFALPVRLRGNPPPFGNLNPAEPLLYK